VVTVCDRVREVCPEFRGGGRRIHWSIADPALAGGDVAATQALFDAIADELDHRIQYLVALIDDSISNEEATTHAHT
jgi:hypothetical protein